MHATGWGFGAYAGEFHLPQFVANHFSTRAEKAQPETLSESFRQAALQAICLEEKGWQENYENLSLGHQLLLDGLQVDKLTSPKRSLRLGVLNCLMGQSFHFRPELQRLVVTPQEVLPKGTYEVKAHQGLEVIHPLVSHPVFLERVIPLLSEDLCENEWPLQERILAIRVLGAILYEMVDRLGVEIKEDEKWGDLRELFNKAVIQLGDAFECDTHVEVRLQIQATLKRLGSLTYLGDAAQAMTQTTAEVLSQEAREQSRSK